MAIQDVRSESACSKGMSDDVLQSCQASLPVSSVCSVSIVTDIHCSCAAEEDRLRVSLTMSCSADWLAWRLRFASECVELSGCCLLPESTHSCSPCACQCCLRHCVICKCLGLTPLTPAAFMYVLVPMPYLFFGSASTSSSSIYGSSNAVASG